MTKKAPAKKKAKSRKGVGGRPALYSSPDALDEKINEYFTTGMRRKTFYSKAGEAYEIPIPTFTDLCIFLGFCDRQSFYDYEKRPEFSCSMKKARTLVEREYEEMLHGNNATGAIFALKNFGWRDKQEIDHTTNGKDITGIKLEFVEPEGD